MADLIKVDEKYETAIETALGGNIQNIVTDTEETAKELIEYLKENRLGRATFLPLTSVGNKDNFPKKEALSEKGAIGLASTLVQAERKYDGIVSYLLGRVLVAEQVDDAIRIARKYGHSIHIVTLEGEYLSPGGSMTGGAFRNSSNLLGRRRELEELEENVRRLKTEMEEARATIEELKERRRKSRQEAENLNGRLQEAYLRQNTAKLNTDQAKTRLQEITADYQELQKELAELESQLSEIRESRGGDRRGAVPLGRAGAEPYRRDRKGQSSAGSPEGAGSSLHGGDRAGSIWKWRICPRRQNLQGKMWHVSTGSWIGSARRRKI